MHNPICSYPMRVLGVHRETADVWTLSLTPEDDYPYQPGQYALVDIPDGNTVRAYTLSSSPGVGEHVALTVRRLPGGVGSTYLTERVRSGDTLRLSAAQGEFTCTRAVDERYLLLAGGCGVTPIMSMARWLLGNRPETDLIVIYSVRGPDDVIFAEEWKELSKRYPERFHLHLPMSRQSDGDCLTGRISREMVEDLAPDVAKRTVMACGPQAYMDFVAESVQELGVPVERIHTERFHAAAECSLSESSMVSLTLSHPTRQIAVPAGTMLLDALEQHGESINAACRAGVCGACKVRVTEGEVLTHSQATLTPDEIEQGYVLACSCQIEGNVVLA